MKLSMCLLGVIVCGLFTIVNIILREYIIALSWVVSTMWAFVAYRWEQTALKQNIIIEEFGGILTKNIAAKTKGFD